MVIPNCFDSERFVGIGLGGYSLKPGSHRKIVKDYRLKTGKDHEILSESE